MISKIASILTVGVAALVFVASPAQALTPAQKKQKIAQYWKQLNNLPKHKAPISKINSILNQLTNLDIKSATKYLNVALTKVSLPNATATATLLTNRTNGKVKSSKQLKNSLKNNIINKNNSLLKKYKPPGPTNPPYQAMLRSLDLAA